MTRRLAGKTALITAAAQGIGKSSVEAFLREGATVVATDVNDDGLAALQGPDGAPDGALTTRHLDVLDADAVAGIAADVGAVDVLFNCAGFVHHGTILDCDEKDWDFSFDLNVKAMYRMNRAFLPAMLGAGGGTIINMSSVSGSIKGIVNRFAYGASKAAVIGMTKAIAADFVGQGIRVHAICPGTVDTPSLRQRVAELAEAQNVSFDEAMAGFVGRQPMGRLGTAEEIAALCVYLASDEASYTTGQAHLIDGGIMI